MWPYTFLNLRLNPWESSLAPTQVSSQGWNATSIFHLWTLLWTLRAEVSLFYPISHEFRADLCLIGYFANLSWFLLPYAVMPPVVHIFLQRSCFPSRFLHGCCVVLASSSCSLYLVHKYIPAHLKPRDLLSLVVAVTSPRVTWGLPGDGHLGWKYIKEGVCLCSQHRQAKTEFPPSDTHLLVIKPVRWAVLRFLVIPLAFSQTPGK